MANLRTAVASAAALWASSTAAFAVDCYIDFSANSVSAGGSAGVYDCQDAGGGTTGGGWNTTAYTGLVLQFGPGRARPQLVVGVRSARVDASDRLEGADLGLRIGLDRRVTISDLRLAGVIGSRQVHLNLGGGYSFERRGWFLTAAAQAPHVRAGLDFDLSGRAVFPYVEANTITPEDPVVDLPESCGVDYDLLVLGQDYVTDFDSNGNSVFNGTNFANAGGTFTTWTVFGPSGPTVTASNICAN